MRHLAALFLALPMMVSGQTFVDMNIFHCGPTVGAIVSDITIDPAGSIYISGEFNGSATNTHMSFDQVNLINQSTHSTAFLAKLNSDLDVQWARPFDGTSDMSCTGLGVIGSGVIAGLPQNSLILNGDTLANGDDLMALVDNMGTITGAFSGNSDLPMKIEPLGGDTFLMCGMGVTNRYDGPGQRVWTFPTDFNYQGLLVTNDVTADADGNVYMVGHYDQLTLDGVTLPPAPCTYCGPLVVKLDPNGSLLWMRTMNTGFATIKYAEKAEDGSGIIVSGQFSSWIESLDGDTIFASGSSDLFIGKFDQNGDLIHLILGESSDNDLINDLITTTDGSVYVSKKGIGQIDGIQIQGDAICKFNSALELQWYKLLNVNQGGYRKIESDINGDIILTMLIHHDPIDYTYTLDGMTDTFLVDAGAVLVARLRHDSTLTSVSGRVYVDVNQNGVYDSGDALSAHTPVISDYQVFSGSTGQYMMGLNAGPHTISCTPPLYFVASPESVALNVPLNTPQIQNVDIRLLPNGNITDLKVHVGSPGVPIPGFDNSYQVTVTNMGNVATGGTVTANLPAGYSYLSASPQPTQVTGAQLTWNMAALPIMQQTAFTVQVNLPATTALGGEMVMSASVATVSTDANPTDNSATHTAIVVGAYDPNDKQAFPAGDLTEYELGEGIEYTIRFQNTGTWPAQNVRLVDTISHLLDVTTIRTIGASHAQTMTHRPGNVVEWLFPSINLPDSSVDQAASQGFVTFHIRPAAGVGLGTTIANQAAIYFDFNAPIITNEVVQSVVTAIAEPLGLRSMMLYPNPATRSVRIDLGQADAPITSVEFIDLTGRKVFTAQGPITSGSPIDVSALQEGIYLVNVCPEGMEPIVDRMVLMR